MGNWIAMGGFNIKNLQKPLCIGCNVPIKATTIPTHQEYICIKFNTFCWLNFWDVKN
jgi:hypothetical protein